MKVFVHYDPNGNIRSIVTVDAPTGVGLMLTPDSGTFVAEIEDLKIKSHEPNLEALREIAETYQISNPVPRATLKKRTGDRP